VGGGCTEQPCGEGGSGVRGDTGGLLFRNQGRLSEIQRQGRNGKHTTHPYDGQAQHLEAGYESGTSVFDPVLVEIAVRWFCPPTGLLLDPFAGGSVRGIVTVKMGRRYIGVDLSERQIVANRAQAEEICAAGPKPDWRVGDSTQIRAIAGDVRADLLFTCPPFGFLERYSDDPLDISNMTYPRFLEQYRTIIRESLALLKDDRFAIFVVGDFRDKDGYLCNFPGDTVTAFLDAGARLYNDGILVTSTGSLPIRAGRQFSSGRKLGRTHQSVLCFIKGDWKRAAEACGEVEE
jgi:hypothetical protein